MTITSTVVALLNANFIDTVSAHEMLDEMPSCKKRWF